MAAIVRRLPFGLSRIVAPSFLGFAIINGFTFSVDPGLLSLCHGVLKWPYPAAVTLSYLTAFALSFVLNRALNFRSHEALGPQTAKYVVAIGINYAAFVVGVGDALTAIGMQYQLARILSGLCEGVYMYSVMRWVVFRDVPRGLRSFSSGGLTGVRRARTMTSLDGRGRGKRCLLHLDNGLGAQPGLIGCLAATDAEQPPGPHQVDDQQQVDREGRDLEPGDVSLSQIPDLQRQEDRGRHHSQILAPPPGQPQPDALRKLDERVSGQRDGHEGEPARGVGERMLDERQELGVAEVEAEIGVQG